MSGRDRLLGPTPCHHASWQWDPRQVTAPPWPSLKWEMKGLASHRAPQVVLATRKQCYLLLLLRPWVAITQRDRQWSDT